VYIVGRHSHPLFPAVRGERHVCHSQLHNGLKWSLQLQLSEERSRVVEDHEAHTHTRKLRIAALEMQCTYF